LATQNRFKVIILRNASLDLESTDIYFRQFSENIALNFFEAVFEHLKVLEFNPYFEVRYDNVRILPIKGKKHNIHFTLDEARQIVRVYAIVSAYKMPFHAKKRKS
jgi:hypothetical protein